MKIHVAIDCWTHKHESERMSGVRINENWRKAFNQVVASDAKYHSAEAREDRDWAVVFFPKTGEARLFPTIERIASWYNHSIFANGKHGGVYVNAKQLGANLSDDQLFELFKQWYARVPAKSSWLAEDRRKRGDDTHKPEPFRVPKTMEKMVAKIWSMIQDKADRVSGVAPQQTNPTASRSLYVVKTKELPGILEKKLPKQFKIIVKALLDDGRETYTDEDMENFMRDLKRNGVLKTKQDSFLVFRYYAPQLSDLGGIEYAGRRQQDEDENIAA